ncbi:MAG: carboxylating nicotinate-nucleotide diphosphorylase [Thermodesulfovibrionales bacterium]|nr:carboxylating nicotinate-nucleotide diphosphorylase [Thermodesulfovibrionales bacterium]
MNIPQEIKEFLKKALEEDILHGDITTELTIPSENISDAIIIAKSNFILAGMPFIKELFTLYDPDIEFNILKKDGSQIERGDVIAKLKGRTHSILACERTGLNILQRLSGIATLTARFVQEIKGTKARILDTRKTTPCMRYLEKYAVRIGGGYNHRFGLYDGILIKDNHIKAAGGIKKAVDNIKNSKAFHHLLKIEVEVKDIEEVNEAVEAGVDAIMLDNMDIEEMKKAVKYIREKKPGILIEASGNVNPGNVRAIAETGVDFISAGMLTHSAEAADISLKIVD